ncbi:MAG: DUF5916 domain-containing protein, partial [Gemmatimonadota bacterium]|nr:DUF5916 domain-containing protein [Gemmatimonadota bacterium]
TLDSALNKAAYALGVDWNHEFSNRNWAFRGNVSGSRVEGSPAAMTRVQTARHHYFQRPDADHLDVDLNATAINGYSASLTLAKQSGRHWLGSIGGAITSGSYEVNDLGFAMRTDRRDIQANLTYRETQPGSFFRYWVANASVRNEQNFSGDNILRIANALFHFSHLNYWSGTVNVRRMFRALDDRSTRGGPLMTRPASSNVFANLRSDGRKPLTVGFNGGFQRDEFGGGSKQIGIDIQIKTSPQWNLTVGPQMQWTEISAQYLGTIPDPAYTQTFGNRYLFANLDYRELSIQTRFNFTFKPGLTLEMYVQPLISAGNFGPGTYLTTPRSFDFALYPVALPDFDFNVRSLRGNAVLRWEWRPGSNIYFAWQQRRYEQGSFGTFDFGRDWGGLFGLPADNIFLVKVSTWFNP